VRRLRILLPLLLLASGFISGCGTRFVVLRPGDPVRLREPLRKVKVWAYDGRGELVPGVVDIPLGWWAHDGLELDRKADDAGKRP